MTATFLTKKEDITAWLIEHKVYNYYLIEDPIYGYVVSVSDSVNLQSRKLEYLPVQFDWVGGNFDCSFNNLTSLQGCPRVTGHNFICSHNQLTSLEYAPFEVKRDFLCDNNQLISSDGISSRIRGAMDVSSNQLCFPFPDFLNDYGILYVTLHDNPLLNNINKYLKLKS